MSEKSIALRTVTITRYITPLREGGSLPALAKGLMKIEKQNVKYVLLDEVTCDEEKQGELKEVFRDGKLLVDYTLAQSKGKYKRVKNYLFAVLPMPSL